MANRKTIPSEVKEILRAEVGFGCPVKGCGNPYLEYHHFDPPVHIRAHNDPKGMIALCPFHHGKADGGAYTVEQLHQLKLDKVNARLVRGNLDWLRRDLLAFVGGNFYHETPRIIVIDGQEVVSLHRDKDGYLRLSVNILSISNEDRLIIKDNFWENIGKPIDLRSPPQGKELEVKYLGGDSLHIKFYELATAEKACEKYKTDIFRKIDCIVFPITAVEVNMTIGGTNITLSPESTNLKGGTIRGGFTSHCGGGLLVSDTGIDWKQNSQWKLAQKIEKAEGSNIIKVNFRM